MPQAAKIAAAARSSVIPLGVYAFSRLVDTLILFGLRSKQTTDPNYFAGGTVPVQLQPRTYGHIISNWDGQWYRSIAQHWYPSTLPTNPDGSVSQNAWAFYPGFPTLCRGLMHLGLSYEASAGLISIVAGGIGCWLLYLLVRVSGSRFTAAMAVVGFCFFPAAVLLQAAYTESLAFALIMGALLSLNKRRYGWFMVCTLALSLTRPVALPLAAVAGLHWLVRWMRRDTEPFEFEDRVTEGAATLMAVASFGVWPMIAAAVTGRLNAYWATANTWALDGHWVSWLSETARVGGQGVLTFTLVAAFAAIVIVTQRSARAWPTELRTWSAAYVLYLLATTRATPSITRYLLLAVVPWWPLPEVSERRLPVSAQVAIALAFATAGTMLQYAWTGTNFIVGPDARTYP
ncbi:hypothetical protein Back2_25440 [Nocardioides baekrokdamisoli]|uniref:Glycosyltransferase RgtA/B/C/D-like domain-containing protein n=1 Tax=Nocardioides baekrokdamisoli TaxID=1804624 RepID=A0A3G9IGX2_9ACTN|nr:hypothetical protein [Nocardioides baekrokdamisoli]BBH18257.1 hypothetical protein Back2_25440 [Nocardioides baekrokdamisoli]